MDGATVTVACIGHHDGTPPEPRHGHLCPSCFRRLTSTFTQLPDVAVWLHANLEPTGGHGERVSGSREAPVPLRLDVLDLIGPTNGPDAVHDDYHDQTGAPNILAVLVSWVRLVCEERERQPPSRQTVTDCCSWLLLQVAWLAEQMWVDELLDDLHRLWVAASRVAPWQPELRRDSSPCARCNTPAVVWHVADGKRVCERRLGGCGRSDAIGDYLFAAKPWEAAG